MLTWLQFEYSTKAAEKRQPRFDSKSGASPKKSKESSIEKKSMKSSPKGKRLVPAAEPQNFGNAQAPVRVEDSKEESTEQEEAENIEVAHSLRISSN